MMYASARGTLNDAIFVGDFIDPGNIYSGAPSQSYVDLYVCYVSLLLLAVIIAIRKGWVKEALALLFFG